MLFRFSQLKAINVLNLRSIGAGSKAQESWIQSQAGLDTVGTMPILALRGSHTMRAAETEAIEEIRTEAKVVQEAEDVIIRRVAGAGIKNPDAPNGGM